MITRLALAALAALLGVSFASADAWAQRSRESRLVVITNFDSTEVQVNGVSYPYEWVEGQPEGLPVPASQRLEVVVSVSPQQRRTFRLRLEPGETRVLMVDIENMGSSPAGVPRTASRAPEAPTTVAAEQEDVGYLGVSSSPRGIVHVDGNDTGERTPARRIPLDPGRHEVQIFYDEEGIMSEVKHVLIRAGVNTNVFFRLRREQIEEAGNLIEED